MVELRLAGATTVEDANRVLWEFLPRYDARFGVAPAQPRCSYRPVSPDLDVGGTLCFKYSRKVARDNTVKYGWRTLQLLPSPDRPSYAGVRVEVQERLDGSLLVCYQGRTIPSQEAPPRASTLQGRNHHGCRDWSPVGLAFDVTRPGLSAGQGRAEVEVLGEERERAAAGSLYYSLNGVAHSLKPLEPPPQAYWVCRQLTPRQQAIRDAVQEAKRQGLSIKATAKTLGINWRTARKYAAAPSPPISSPKYVRNVPDTDRVVVTVS